MENSHLPAGADEMTLVTLFEVFYAKEPDCAWARGLRRTSLKPGSYAQKFRWALKWLRLALGREAVVGDLNEAATIAGFFRFCLDKGQSVATVESFRRRLVTLQGYAVRRGLLAQCPTLPAVVGQPKPRLTGQGLPSLGTLPHYFEFTFRPSVLQHRAEKTCEHYTAAVNWFVRFRNGKTLLTTIGKGELDAFNAWLESAAVLSDVIRRRYVGSIRAVLVHAGRIEECTPKKSPRTASECVKEAARHKEGSLERFLFSDYVLGHELEEPSIQRYATHVHAFGRFLKRAPMLSDLNTETVNRYLCHLQEEKRAAATVKGARTHLLALWRSAWDVNRLENKPRGVRKVRVRKRVESWTPDEVAALLRAVDRLFIVRDESGNERHKVLRNSRVSLDLFFRALILADWDSALRLSDVLGLSLESILEHADGTGECVIEQSKTCRYIRFRLRAETMRAMRACAASGAGELANRAEPWSFLNKKEVQKYFGKIVANAMEVDGIRFGTFKWLRRASITNREATAQGDGTVAAGHGGRQVTLQHYIDSLQLPAAPLPCPLVAPGSEAAATGDAAGDQATAAVDRQPSEPATAAAKSAEAAATGDQANRRGFLKAGLGMLACAVLPKHDSAAASGVETWLRTNAANLRDPAAAASSVEAWLRTNAKDLPDLASILAEWERTGVEDSYPDVWDRMRYVTVFEWSPGVVYCVGFCAAGAAPAMFAAAKTAGARAAGQVVAEGWSEDKRVWSFFAVGEIQHVEPAIRALALPMEAWREFEVGSVDYRGKDAKVRRPTS